MMKSSKPVSTSTAPKLVSESCMNFLTTEMVAYFEKKSETKEDNNNNNNNNNNNQNINQKDKKRTSKEAKENPKEETKAMFKTPDRGLSIEIERKKVSHQRDRSLDTDFDEDIDYLQSQILKNYGEEKDLFQIGVYVGKRFIERLSKPQLRFTSDRDIIRFIRSEFWPVVFCKQLEQVGTPKGGNKKGVYLLRDLKFKPLTRFSLGTHQDTQSACSKYLLFPCGLLKGALANLGMDAHVTCDQQSLPQCTFRVEMLNPPQQ